MFPPCLQPSSSTALVDLAPAQLALHTDPHHVRRRGNVRAAPSVRRNRRLPGGGSRGCEALGTAAGTHGAGDAAGNRDHGRAQVSRARDHPELRAGLVDPDLPPVAAAARRPPIPGPGALNPGNGSVNRLLLALLLALSSVSPVSAQEFDHAHRAWTAMLEKHVVLLDGKASQVRYAGFAQDRLELKGYLASLSKVTQEEFDGWSKAQQTAFLINAYNAFTVEKILTRYPDIRSIWDFGKIFGNPFKDRFFKLLGSDSYLDRVEHETLRRPGAYDEPRVHFAVNCASIGCPMLREEAYVAERLAAELEEKTVRFLSDRTRNRYNADTGRLEVSKIFDWFKEDWMSGYRGLEGKTAPVRTREQYFARYAALLADAPGHRKQIQDEKAELRFLDYDWALNDARR